MFYIYHRDLFTYHTQLTLMDDNVKFRSKSNARAYLYSLGFSRKEQEAFVVCRFKTPPAWITLPAKFKGDL